MQRCRFSLYLVNKRVFYLFLLTSRRMAVATIYVRDHVLHITLSYAASRRSKEFYCHTNNYYYKIFILFLEKQIDSPAK